MKQSETATAEHKITATHRQSRQSVSNSALMIKGFLEV
jgi:hypothetical protein